MLGDIYAASRVQFLCLGIEIICNVRQVQSIISMFQSRGVGFPMPGNNHLEHSGNISSDKSGRRHMIRAHQHEQESFYPSHAPSRNMFITSQDTMSI